MEALKAIVSNWQERVYEGIRNDGAWDGVWFQQRSETKSQWLKAFPAIHTGMAGYFAMPIERFSAYNGFYFSIYVEIYWIIYVSYPIQKKKEENIEKKTERKSKNQKAKRLAAHFPYYDEL